MGIPGIPDIRQLITCEFEVYGHVQGELLLLGIIIFRMNKNHIDHFLIFIKKTYLIFCCFVTYFWGQV